jgi:hypothetical protein
MSSCNRGASSVWSRAWSDFGPLKSGPTRLPRAVSERRRARGLTPQGAMTETTNIRALRATQFRTSGPGTSRTEPDRRGREDSGSGLGRLGSENHRRSPSTVVSPAATSRRRAYRWPDGGEVHSHWEHQALPLPAVGRSNTMPARPTTQHTVLTATRQLSGPFHPVGVASHVAPASSGIDARGQYANGSRRRARRSRSAAGPE